MTEERAVSLVRESVGVIAWSDFLPSEEARLEAADRERLRGTFHFERNELVECLVCLDLAVALAPSDHRILANRALARLKAGKTDLALDDANRTIALAPQWPKGYYRLGQVQMAREDFLNAFLSFERSLARDPQSATVKEAIDGAAAALLSRASLALREVFVYSQQLQPTGKATQRAGHCVVMHGGKMLVIGGSAGPRRMHEVLSLDLDTLHWTRPPVRGPPPPAAQGHSAVSDGGSFVLVFGGWADALQPVDHLWVLNADTWQADLLRTEGLVPAARAWHSATYLPALKAMAVFGGRDADDRPLQDLYLLLIETATWLRIVPASGPVPPARSGHCSTLLPDGRLLVFGGCSHTDVFNDLWAFDFAARAWTSLRVITPSPPPRAGHSMCSLPDGRVVVFGGDTRGERTNDLWLFYPSFHLWHRPLLSGRPPAPRCVHAAAIRCGRRRRVSPVVPAGGGLTRGGPLTLYSGNQCFVYGGADVGDAYGDLYALDVDQLAHFELPRAEIEIGAEVGRGATAIVFSGMFRGRPVAVKRFLGEALARASADAETFRRETTIMCQLKHPHVLSLVGVCTAAGVPLMVTEWAGRGNLYDLLRREPAMPLSERIRLAAEAASGMAYLHARTVLHRDLKSLNILVTDERTAMVADFGLSNILGQGAAQAACDGLRGATQLNQTLAGYGTIPWTAPEVLQSPSAAAPPADVYSFGVVMYELLTGRDPYTERNPAVIAARVLTKADRPAVPADAPPRYTELMRRCWAQAPGDRPVFAEVAEQLWVMWALEVALERAIAVATA